MTLPTNSHLPKLYVGCALTEASEEFRAAIDTLRHELDGGGHGTYCAFWG